MEIKSAKRIDMLSGSIWRKVPQFALPVAATAILEQLFNASDIAIVGNFTGDAKTAAVAAVGANSPIIALILNFFIGIALGANVIIASAIGRRDSEAVQAAVHTSVVFAFLGGIVVTAFGELASGAVLRSLNVPEEVLPMALQYLRIYLAGMPVILLYNFEAAIFRSIGNTKTPLMALAFSGVLNILLNLFFVAILHMTVDGVAIATVISNAISSAILFVLLLKMDGDAGIRLKKLGINLPILGKILKIGLPAGIQGAVFAVSNIVIQSAINVLGKMAMAASSAAVNIEVFAYDVFNSFSQACTTFVGQNYGAGNINRCRSTYKICLAEGLIAIVLTVSTVLFFGKSLLAIFNNDPEVVDMGYIRLVLVLGSYAFSVVYEVTSGYLRGFGISLVPAILTTIGVCVVRILWINFVFPQSPTFTTIMIAYPISLCLTALLMLGALLYYRPAEKRS